MDKENFTISCFANAYIGDDGAVADGFVYSKDLFFEDSHFKRKWLSLKQIGYKAMLVNISDTIVMNAVPKYALLGLALPKTLSQNEIKELSLGIKKACDEFKIQLIGGDTIGSDKIYISITIIGALRGRPIERKGLKNGDFLAFTGKLGDSLKGLKRLQNGGSVAKNSRFASPILKDRFFYKACKFINSAMDISDGLGTDLAKLCGISRRGVKFIKKLSNSELKSGEEYEILFSFSVKNIHKIRRLAKKTRTNITIFAKATKGNFKTNARTHHF